MDTAALARLISQRYQRLTGNHHNEENEFAKKLRGLINTALVYDNDGLPDEALEVLPLERLYNTAEERSKDETWGMQDYLIMELLKWFKQEYFTWVNSPKCYFCEVRTFKVLCVTM
jgi:peptide-N4-(N-acetyl-beta-glucosaminyl)asparagine amidase